MGRIQDMRTPVAQCPHAEIIPAAPLPVDIIVVIVVLLRNGRVPKIPVQRVRDWLCRWKGFDIRVPPMPTTRRRSEEHTSELQSLMRISYAVFCLKKKTKNTNNNTQQHAKQHTIRRYTSTNEVLYRQQKT